MEGASPPPLPLSAPPAEQGPGSHDAFDSRKPGSLVEHPRAQSSARDLDCTVQQICSAGLPANRHIQTCHGLLIHLTTSVTREGFLPPCHGLCGPPLSAPGHLCHCGFSQSLCGRCCNHSTCLFLSSPGLGPIKGTFTRGLFALPLPGTLWRSCPHRLQLLRRHL